MLRENVLVLFFITNFSVTLEFGNIKSTDMTSSSLFQNHFIFWPLLELLFLPEIDLASVNLSLQRDLFNFFLRYPQCRDLQIPGNSTFFWSLAS
jgi:hypothetical protein